MFVPTSDSGVKKYCCIYCLKRYQNLARHLQTVHKNEVEVQNFQAFRPRKFLSLILVHSLVDSGRIDKASQVFYV